MFRRSSCAAVHRRSTANAAPASEPQRLADASRRSRGVLAVLHIPTSTIADDCLGPRAVLGVEVFVGRQVRVAPLVLSLVVPGAVTHRRHAAAHCTAGGGPGCWGAGGTHGGAA